jgi:photosystem I subunit XI
MEAMIQLVEKIQRHNDDPRDPRNRTVIHPPHGDPQIGNLETPINSSPFVMAFINNLPVYRKGLSPLRRGLEVGLAHGYWIVGPFAKFNPLRDTDLGTLTALFSTIGIILVSTISISLYAASNPPAPTVTLTTPNPPDAFKHQEGWDEYAGGFFIGGVGGALFAFTILANNDVFKNFLNIAGL